MEVHKDTGQTVLLRYKAGRQDLFEGTSGSKLFFNHKFEFLNKCIHDSRNFAHKACAAVDC